MESSEKINDLMALPASKHHRDWEPFMRKYHCDTVCELGVRAGENFKYMIAHNPKLAVAVDCWKDDGIAEHNDMSFYQDELDKQYEDFKNSMADKPFVKICRGYSFDVVGEFPDEFFDLVYIDADHTYDGCKRDINDWYPKVKKGGVLCGHDYQRRKVRVREGQIRFGVIPAVDEFVKANNISTFFVLPQIVWGLIK